WTAPGAFASGPRNWAATSRMACARAARLCFARSDERQLTVGQESVRGEDAALVGIHARDSDLEFLALDRAARIASRQHRVQPEQLETRATLGSADDGARDGSPRAHGQLEAPPGSGRRHGFEPNAPAGKRRGEHDIQVAPASDPADVDLAE